MKIGFWDVQIDIEKAFLECGHKVVALDFHKSDWQNDFVKADCDAYVWYPHALHKEYYKLLDRAGFIEFFLSKRAFPNVRTSYLFQDKMRQEYVFDLLRIPQPKTIILTSQAEINKFLKLKIKFPLIVKDMWNYGGYGIFVLKNKKELEKYIAKKRIPKNKENVIQKHYLYLQEYIDLREEYRVMTVGQKIILVYRKKADKFLGHVWRGAKVDFEVKKDVLDFVRKYNKILKLDCCGWDLARNKQGKLKIIELNPIAGTKILEEQGISLAEHIAEYVEKVL
ncbi:MAG: ATP-grasp domain-containing protein [Patescibacteria group bacterium]|nr:ATP-grasp domain-containing protein [Patescibacteria group bacterium]